MSHSFKTIGIIGRRRREPLTEVINTLIACLHRHHCDVILESETAKNIHSSLNSVHYNELGKRCDLLISVGGDGNLLSASRAAAPHDTPILGINRGKFGFLTDIRPHDIEVQISEILNNQFVEEKRFMLKAKVYDGKQVIAKNWALNDIIITPSTTAKMLNLDIHVNDDFMCHQESDGLIIATPTGSTAYALSGGGPILHASLNAIVMVPMFPHTLSQRPIVLNGDSIIHITMPDDLPAAAHVTCDGQDYLPAKAGNKIEISKADKPLRLLHPLSYNYFATLRSKLHWGHRHKNED